MKNPSDNLYELLEGNQICIYCFGKYGIKTYYILKKHRIEVKCFGDSNNKKKEYTLDGKSCLSYDEVCMLSKDTIIIVANKNPKKLIVEFKKLGFWKVLSCHELIQYFKIQGERKKNIDFLSMEEILLIKQRIDYVVNNERFIENSNNNQIEEFLSDYLKRRQGVR